jgi:hypothetical protein
MNSTYNIILPEDKEPVLALIMEVTTNLYNELSIATQQNITSVDILDFVQVVKHPKIEKLLDEIKPTDVSISKTYSEMRKILKDPSFENNSLIKAYRAKLVNESQLFQCVGVRGFVSEVDGAIMSTPVLTNYTRGMRTVHDAIAESRSAAKAYYFSEGPLQRSEYFARRLQLLAMVVEDISYTD